MLNALRDERLTFINFSDKRPYVAHTFDELTPWSRVLEKRTVAQMVKNCSLDPILSQLNLGKEDLSEHYI